MDPFQERLARLGLSVLDAYGFALAGGFALQVHELVHRLSEDIDLFTDSWDPGRFGEAIAAVCNTFEREGLAVKIDRRAETFARLRVEEPASRLVATVDLAADFRRLDPVVLSVGPVISESDAVGSKVAAAFSRGEARDYIDLAAIVISGRHSLDDLIRLATDVDAGFSRQWFAEALASVDRFPDSTFAAYGLDKDTIDGVRALMRSLSMEISQQQSPIPEAQNPRRASDRTISGISSPRHEPPGPGIAL